MNFYLHVKVKIKLPLYRISRRIHGPATYRNGRQLHPDHRTTQEEGKRRAGKHRDFKRIEEGEE